MTGLLTQLKIGIDFVVFICMQKVTLEILSKKHRPMQAVLLCRLFRLLFLRQVLLSLFGNFSRGHHPLEDQGALLGLHMQQPGNLLAIGEACLLQIVPYGRRLFLRRHHGAGR